MNIFEAHREQVLHNWRELFDRIAPPANRKRYAELIRITGGEPTLHPEFCEIINYIDAFNIPHALFTNGRWLNPDEIIEIFIRCQNFIGMLISLHGSTPDAHNAFIDYNNGHEVFEDVCNNIRNAAEAGLRVHTSSVITRHNSHQIQDIIELSRELGAEYAVFNRYLGKPSPIEPSEKQLGHAIVQIEQSRKEGMHCRIGDSIPPCFEDNSSVGSNGGIEHCTISPTGLVRPDNLTSYVFGNIFEENIIDIWNSKKARLYREKVPSFCLECVELSRCRGGCRPLIIEYGLERDPLARKPIYKCNDRAITLDPDWRPVPYFHVREETFGYLLVHYNWAVPVSFEAKPILDAIDGQITLVDLQRKFGDEALNLLGHLYKEGCIGFLTD